MSSHDPDRAQEGSRPIPFSDLGLTPEQSATLLAAASEPKGLILFAGVPGSGKSVTLFSLLSELDLGGRTLMSVEDPIEYHLPTGTQLEVGVGSGATLEALLSDAVEADPEILVLGEITDLVGAWALVEFANQGHLALATIPSCNATTAIFRLERLGVSRDRIGEALRAVVAQRLLSRLCPLCRKTRSITPEERDLLAPFSPFLPEEVAHPTGCPVCGGSGFRGKKAVYEVLSIDPETAQLISGGLSIAQIRQRARDERHLLLTDRGLQGIRDLEFPVRDVYEDLLLEDLDRTMAGRVVSGALTPRSEEAALEDPTSQESAGTVAEEHATSVLVVEDDNDTRQLLERWLARAGFRVSLAEDGSAALLKLATESVDLILSDIHMPKLDGMKLLELVHQHGIDAPVVLLTAERSEEVERRGHELGATDFIRKPVEEGMLLKRLREALGESSANPGSGGGA